MSEKVQRVVVLKPINHVKHIIITALTGGIWFFLYYGWALLGRILAR